MDFAQTLLNRRAVNFFDPAKDVSEELLHNIITDAAKTPSSFNLQPWNVIVLRELDEKMKLRQLAMNQPKVTEAPVVLIVLADRSGWKQGNPTLERNFTEMMAAGSMKEAQRDWFYGACANLYGKDEQSIQAFALKNTAFFAMSLMFAASSRGVATHPMDGFDHDAVLKAFNIPSNYWIPLLLAVGFFPEDEEMPAPKWRKDASDIIVRF